MKMSYFTPHQTKQTNRNTHKGLNHPSLCGGSHGEQGILAAGPKEWQVGPPEGPNGSAATAVITPWHCAVLAAPRRAAAQVGREGQKRINS